MKSVPHRQVSNSDYQEQTKVAWVKIVIGKLLAGKKVSQLLKPQPIKNCWSASLTGPVKFQGNG